jgi:sulfite exporter TauE/SafE
MNAFDLSIPFGLGVVSSLHCVQMCGPIVMAWSLPLHRAARPLAAAHVAYNTGRIVTYSLLGAAAGAVGGGLTSLGRLAGAEKIAAIVSGIAMIVAGLLISGWMPKKKFVQIGGEVPSLLARAARSLFQTADARSKLLLGLVLGFLPCGLVYVALIKAIETGSALDGALTMAAFGAGTTFALLGVGLFSSAIAARLGRHAGTLAAVSALFVGAFLIWKGVTASPAPKCH